MKRAFKLLLALIAIVTCTYHASAQACFDDQNLAQMRHGNLAGKGVLIYVWSPRMVYSVHNAAAAALAAQSLGLRFVALHDPKVSEQDAASIASVAALASESARPLCAAQLIEREALRHFPTAFVLHGAAIHPHPIVGAMPAEFWTRSIAQRLPGH